MSSSIVIKFSQVFFGNTGINCYNRFMKKSMVSEDILFDIKNILGRKIRTTKSYWKKIKEVKHTELKFGISEVKKTLKIPDEVRKSVTDATILLYAKSIEKYDILIVAVKVLDSNGFLVTVYQTKKYKKKGELVWPKQKEKPALSKAEG